MRSLSLPASGLSPSLVPLHWHGLLCASPTKHQNLANVCQAVNVLPVLTLFCERLLPAVAGWHLEQVPAYKGLSLRRRKKHGLFAALPLLRHGRPVEAVQMLLAVLGQGRRAGIQAMCVMLTPFSQDAGISREML